MAASVSAHLLMQDALATVLRAEALPVAVDAKLLAASRIGTGPEQGPPRLSSHEQISGVIEQIPGRGQGD